MDNKKKWDIRHQVFYDGEKQELLAQMQRQTGQCILTSNDWAATEGGGLNFCLLKPPAVVTPVDKIHSTLLALPTETNTVVKGTQCHKHTDDPYNNKVNTCHPTF